MGAAERAEAETEDVSFVGAVSDEERAIATTRQHRLRLVEAHRAPVPAALNSTARHIHTIQNIRADFHATTVATAPNKKKLLTGRGHVRNWTRRTISSLFILCIKLHLFLGKSTKTAATSAALFDSNMHQIVCRLGLRPRPHCGELTVLPRPPSCI